MPKENMLAMFKKLAASKLPKGSKYQDEWSFYGIDKDGSFTNKLTVSLRILPEPFAAYISQIDAELNDYAKRTVNLLRWRCGTRGHHNPISSHGASWSFDRENWYPTPLSMQAHTTIFSYVRTTHEVLEDVKEYMQENKNQPLGYELFLEAWSQRMQNPRSSLILGIAAAETAFKHCVSTFVPDAKWLIENTASPDLIKMLADYLPQLPTSHKINGKVFEAGASIRETLQVGVQMRNQIVHGRSTALTYEKLDEILQAVIYVLRILDYCSGFNWAKQYINDPDILKNLDR